MQVMLELKRRNLRKTVKIVKKKWKNVTQNTPNLEIFSGRSLCIQHLLFFLNYQLRELLYLASALQIFFHEIGKMLILVQVEASVVLITRVPEKAASV